MLKPYKFEIIAIAQETDDEGSVTGEQIVSAEGKPFTVFGVDGLKVFADVFEAQLLQAPGPQAPPA